MEHLSLFRSKKRYIRANPYPFTKKKKKWVKKSWEVHVWDTKF